VNVGSDLSDGDMELFRFDGDSWIVEATSPLGAVGLACGHSDVWHWGAEESDWAVYRLQNGSWMDVAVEYDSYVNADVRDVWAAGDGEAWVVGEDSDVQAWVVTGAYGSKTMEGRTKARQEHMSAIWRTASGRVLAFGDSGLVFDR
jgi:hypothetical protein